MMTARRTRKLVVSGAAALVFFLTGTAGAAPPTPAASLTACESAVRKEGEKFEKGSVRNVATCLQKMATEVIQNDSAPAAAATSVASACVSAFRKLNDSRGLGLSLDEKMTAAVGAKCDPVNPGVTHTLNDVTGKAAGLVAQQIDTVNVDAWCQQFGGDGSIDTVGEWTGCLQASHECGARTALSTQYPRALEWLDLIIPAMALVTPPATDPNRVTDALAAANAVNAAIEGGDNDDVPDIQCGSTCGDGVKNGSESCDGADLGGVTCASLGFTGGTLGCTASCGFDPSGCACTAAAGAFPATGQTMCWNSSGAVISCAGTGHDGDIQAGATLSYTDNGDGTITDNVTGLMWEKQSDDGSIHDKDTDYTWNNAFSVHVAGLNAAVFAGHTDWRLPNIGELLGILNHENFAPPVSPAFNTGCVPGCTVPTCSCTSAGLEQYWSSTSHAGVSGAAWGVSFADGELGGFSAHRPPCPGGAGRLARLHRQRRRDDHGQHYGAHVGEAERRREHPRPGHRLHLEQRLLRSRRRARCRGLRRPHRLAAAECQGAGEPPGLPERRPGHFAHLQHRMCSGVHGADL